MPRLFVGTPHPEDLTTQAVLDALGDPRNVKPVDPDQYHVTLAFIGDVPDKHIKRAREAVRACSQAISPTQATVKGLGAFPSPKRASVLWAGIEGAPLGKLAGTVRSELAARELDHDTRDFHAHLTLARLRSKQDVSSLVSTHRGVEFGTLPVDAIHLYASELTPKGPEYTVVDRVELEGSS